MWLPRLNQVTGRTGVLRRCVGLALVLAAGLVLPSLWFGMHPNWPMLPGLVLIQLAVLLPVVLAYPRLRLVWRLFVVVVWLPVTMLSLATHRLPASLTPEEVGITWPHESFVVESADGVRLAGLRFPLANPRGVVVLVHGIGAEKCQFLPAVRPLRSVGFEVFTYDQRNHGASGGWTCTLGKDEAEDLVRVWGYVLRQTDGVPGPRLVYGVSLGGAAAQLAADRLARLDGLILDSTFARLSVVAESRLPVVGCVLVPALAFLRADVLVTGRRLLDLEPIAAARGAVTGSGFAVLLLHANGDGVIPASESRALKVAYGARAQLAVYEADCHALGFLDRPHDHAADLHQFVARVQR
ncbi:MAG: alpha/beta fold hydrolase [Planctomycetota bacterium]